MIKECKVLSYNKYLNILVFVYNDKLIQTTYMCKEAPETVFVNNKDGKYKIVSKREYEKLIRNSRKQEVIKEVSEKAIKIGKEETIEEIVTPE